MYSEEADFKEKDTVYSGMVTCISSLAGKDWLESHMPLRCNVCGEALVPYLPKVSDPLTMEIFAVDRCKHCGLGHTMPQPIDLGRYYAQQYYGNRHGFTLRHCVNRRKGFVESTSGAGVGRRILDIGCGDGSFLLAAKASGWHVMGTELNPEPARSTGLDVKERIEEIPSINQFDCITMWHTLEHMRDIPSMLGHANRLLKQDGRLIISVPDWGGLQSMIFGSKWLHFDVPRHLYHFDAGSLQYALSSAGFSIERRWHQEAEYDLLGWSQSALNFLFPQPNIFFDTLTGKTSKAGSFLTATSFLLGSLLTVLSLPVLVAGTALGRGGSLIVVAGKNRSRRTHAKRKKNSCGHAGLQCGKDA
jgi:SAM-dependent methyltransferase